MKQNLRTPLAVFLCAIALVSAQAQTLNDSLIAHFPMDGSPNDVIGALVPTVTSGAPTFCADRFGNPNGAACFDGASFWSYGDVLDMDTSDFSIAAWVRIDTVLPPFEIAAGFVSEGSTILGKGNSIFSIPERAGYSLMGRNSGGASIDLYGATGDQNDDVRLTLATSAPDQWTHIVLSRCGANQAVHLNGTMVADSIIPMGRNLDVNTVFCLGGMDRNPSTELDSEWLYGALDDVRVYKGRCLSQTEVNTLVNGTDAVVERSHREIGLRLSPNPATSIMRVDFADPRRVNGSTLAINALGQQFLLNGSEWSMAGAAIQSLTLDVSGLPAGAYFVVVPAENGKLHGRFIKQ